MKLKAQLGSAGDLLTPADSTGDGKAEADVFAVCFSGTQGALRETKGVIRSMLTCEEHAGEKDD